MTLTAIARPIPRDAPVTITTFPANAAIDSPGFVSVINIYTR